LFAGASIKNALQNANFVRALRHVKRALAITYPVEATTHARDEQKGQSFESTAEELYKRSESNLSL
jgi:hypothetical protein